jgi:hypothetical protein
MKTGGKSRSGKLQHNQMTELADHLGFELRNSRLKFSICISAAISGNFSEYRGRDFSLKGCINRHYNLSRTWWPVHPSP